MNILSKIKASYIFNALAIAIIIITFIIYNVYQNTKNEIVNISYEDNLVYVKNITKNISHDISHMLKKDFYTTLKSDKTTQEHLNSTLGLFVTQKYKYIYLVDKPDARNDDFRFLADGSLTQDDKSEFAEMFKPLQTSKWDAVLRTEKPVFFKHSEVDTLWTTYLNPIILNGKVEAILVIDFSLQEQNRISQTLHAMENMFKIGNMFIVCIILLILWFSYINNKRERQKNMAFELLKEESKKVHNLNTNLESRVKEEVDKNIIKDKQLIQQSRLAQMGEMISMIAHQWRQPLSVISAIAITLNVKAELDKADKETVIDFSKKISEYSQHLSSTIDDFRDFYKPDKEKENTTYTALIESVLRIVETEISTYGINIIKDLQCDNEFYSYPSELKQVILNILKNAQDVLIEKNIQNPYIKIVTYTKDERLILEISDNGEGVADDIIDKVFEPYFSTKLDKNGTGIGLYMSKLIIQEHCNGKLSVENTQEGAMFKITL